MTDDEILDAFHTAVSAHELNKASLDLPDEMYSNSYDAAAAAEKEMKMRFGNEAWKRYRKRYPSSI